MAIQSTNPVPAPALSVRALTRRYAGGGGIVDVCFEVESGQVVGLIGANGAGKTTTLECVLGLRAADAGEVRIFGHPAGADRRGALTRIGAALQPAALHERLRVREMLALCSAFYPDVLPVEPLLRQFGLTDQADEMIATLSTGQRQRLSLALAWLHRPGLLLLDEPTLGLDPAMRAQVHGLIHALRAAGAAVLLTTNDLQEAHSLCDRVALLRAGWLIECGQADLAQLFAAPADGR